MPYLLSIPLNDFKKHAMILNSMLNESFSLERMIESMNILEEIKAHKDDLTPKELKIFHIVMNNPIDISSSTTSQIAARYHVSQSSISRFCQKVGYSSFSDFRMALYLSSSTNKFDELKLPEFQDFTYYMCEQVKAVKAALTDTLLHSLAERILNSDSIYVSGATYSSIPAQLLTQQLVLASVPAHFVPNGNEIELLHITRNTDTFILFSAGNPTHADFLNFTKEISLEKKPYTILITFSNKHPLRKLVDAVICLPNWVSLHYPVSVDNSFTTNTFCNIFFNYLMNFISEH